MRQHTKTMPTQPSAKRIAKATAGIVGSSSHFERMLRESGAFECLSPAEVVQLQHTIEQYVVAIAANSGLRVRSSVQVCAAALSREALSREALSREALSREALSREEARGGPADA
jgi:hypothetical protein